MKSDLITLKVYDKAGRLFVTKPFNPDDISRCSVIIYEIKHVIQATTVYLKRGNTSKRIYFKNNPSCRLQASITVPRGSK